MRIDDFDYDLPADRIAQVPPERRDDARLLVLDRSRDTVAHRSVRDLPALLHPGDVVVLNDTRVLRARLFARRDTGGRVEVLCIAPTGDDFGGDWEALVRAGGALQEGERLAVGSVGSLELRRRLGPGRWVVAADDGGIPALMAGVGKMPLPPYIERAEEDPLDEIDLERYQTVFAKNQGAITAPTAGLHLSEAILDEVAASGVTVTSVTLHVGLGTFLPIRAETVEEHEMHSEAYVIPQATVDAVANARIDGGRVIAVGTTTVRALEGAAAASADGSVRAGESSTDLFITPGFEFRVVDALLTNFHLPRSTLLCLVSALAGRERILEAYRDAVERGYRFYSYGDAMLIT